MHRRIAEGLVAVCAGVVLTLATMPSLRVGAQAPRPMPRIELYGDSLVSETGAEFATLAQRSGAAVQVHTFPGISPCDYFASMAAAAHNWHPTVAMLSFTGDSFTPCMVGVPLGTPAYFTKYREDMRTAISIFRAVGAKVVLVGLPADSSALLTRNATALNRLYRSLATASPGVTFDDAGRSVTAKGRFTWRLPCLSGEPCTGPHGTNIVRAPDGVHFCPDGRTSPYRGLEYCDVYASGAFRFASAMLQAALGSHQHFLPVTTPPGAVPNFS